MTELHDAVILILNRLKTEGLEWYRGASTEEVGYFESRITGNFAVFGGEEIYNIGRKPKGSFPNKKILVMPPSNREAGAILGLWLYWNFGAEPFEFRLFLGQWSQVDGAKTFIAFRFEAPEIGEEHNYFHCQPCRNFGDKGDNVPNAAIVSQKFPTIPINATNIVELTVCALMAAMGHKKMKAFVKKLLRESAASGNSALTSVYSRYFK
jgi:hypothetical protein